jgi:hypothetical protein
MYSLLYYFQINVCIYHLNLPFNLQQKLLWSGFCENAFPNGDTQLTLMDWLGRSWKCNMRIEPHPQQYCYIYGEWPALCKAHRLIEGVTIKLGVTNTSNNKLIHFRISPFLGVRTTWVAPTSAGGHKAFYQTEHHFML